MGAYIIIISIIALLRTIGIVERAEIDAGNVDSLLQLDSRRYRIVLFAYIVSMSMIVNTVSQETRITCAH